MESYEKKEKYRRKLRLMKYVAVTEDLEHFKSGDVVHTLNGISELNCFVFCNRDGSVMKRYLTCNCAHCNAMRWSECEFKYAFGEVQRFEFVMVTQEGRELRKENGKSKKRKGNASKENAQADVAQPMSKRRRLNGNEPLQNVQNVVAALVVELVAEFSNANDNANVHNISL